MDKIWLIVSALIAYLIGSISTSIIVAKISAGIDIRQHGSGNAGATNTLRTLGKKAALYVLLGDFLKGIIAVVIAGVIADAFKCDKLLFECVAGFMVVMGHNFPVYFGFKGGKGVLTSFSVILILDWKIALLLLLCEAVVIAIWKMVSLGSCLAAVLFMVLSVVLRRSDVYFVVLSFVLSIILIYRHRTNISRIIKGEESKLKF